VSGSAHARDFLFADNTYCSAPTKLVAISQNEHGAKQATDLVDSGHETLVDTVILGIGEVRVESRPGDDTTHHTLIITEEKESIGRNGRDEKPELAAGEASKPGGICRDNLLRLRGLGCLWLLGLLAPIEEHHGERKTMLRTERV
jgi:hypothetical protein